MKTLQFIIGLIKNKEQHIFVEIGMTKTFGLGLLLFIDCEKPVCTYKHHVFIYFLGFLISINWGVKI